MSVFTLREQPPRATAAARASQDGDADSSCTDVMSQHSFAPRGRPTTTVADPDPGTAAAEIRAADAAPPDATAAAAAAPLVTITAELDSGTSCTGDAAGAGLVGGAATTRRLIGRITPIGCRCCARWGREVAPSISEPDDSDPSLLSLCCTVAQEDKQRQMGTVVKISWVVNESYKT
jgi:hypothetical protein